MICQYSYSGLAVNNMYVNGFGQKLGSLCEHHGY